MRSLGTVSPALNVVADDIDLIGWTEMLHGRIPISLTQFQQGYCASINSRMTGQDWARAFVAHLLQISHGQWMYRNFSLHSKVRGHLKLTQQEQVLTEIARLADSNPEDIPAESRFLLEVEVTTLDQKSTEHQTYWIAAMKAALKAGKRQGRYTGRRSQGRLRRQTSDIVPTSSTAAQRRNLHRFQQRIESLNKSLREDLDLDFGSWRSKRPHSDFNSVDNGSNKRFRKPD